MSPAQHESLRAEMAALGVAPATCRRVLLVDDQPDNLAVLVAVLDDDWDVSVADDGQAALAQIERDGPPDLIISDQRMPGLTGVEFLERVSRRYPEVARMVLTGYTDVEPMVDAVNRGAVSRFMFKPWDGDEMRSAVAEILSVREARLNLERLVAALGQRRAELHATLEEQVRAQEQLAASERLATLGRLTAGITHDVRNQLGVLVFLVEELRVGVDDPKVQAGARTALASLRALFTLVRDVNAFARSRPLAVEAETFDVAEIVAATVRLVEHDPAARAVRFEIQVDEGVAALEGDPLRIRQALTALLRNAALAQPRSPVRVRVQAAERAVVFDVVDDGVGMTPEQIARAKEPFYSMFPGQNLGLGLTIAEMVARSHNGKLDLESRPGAATHARLTIPSPAAAS
ncbi:MAG: hybrid sensor histidine kinase/response regulator [Myxococcales bacterium]|nr:hybrid sensor histidine kinase/response regulator [Myxococcales bacterium]